ncbi:hypothetical protein JL720_14165 [Aureococcus anophagefferens]|nr:hypothetical protein JL720_14165 [Aureococcus anophagefferens]
MLGAVAWLVAPQLNLAGDATTRRPLGASGGAPTAAVVAVELAWTSADNGTLVANGTGFVANGTSAAPCDGVRSAAAAPSTRYVALALAIDPIAVSNVTCAVVPGRRLDDAAPRRCAGAVERAASSSSSGPRIADAADDAAGLYEQRLVESFADDELDTICDVSATVLATRAARPAAGDPGDLGAALAPGLTPAPAATPGTTAAPVLEPTPGPTAAPTACDDSGAWHKNGAPSKDCDWVQPPAALRGRRLGRRGRRGRVPRRLRLQPAAAARRRQARFWFDFDDPSGGTDTGYGDAFVDAPLTGAVDDLFAYGAALDADAVRALRDRGGRTSRRRRARAVAGGGDAAAVAGADGAGHAGAERRALRPRPRPRLRRVRRRRRDRSPSFTWGVDLDQDGDMDVLTTSLHDNTVAWSENDGNQSFTERLLTSTAMSAAFASSATSTRTAPSASP